MDDSHPQVRKSSVFEKISPNAPVSLSFFPHIPLIPKPCIGELTKTWGHLWNH